MTKVQAPLGAEAFTGRYQTAVDRAVDAIGFSDSGAFRSPIARQKALEAAQQSAYLAVVSDGFDLNVPRSVSTLKQLLSAAKPFALSTAGSDAVSATTAALLRDLKSLGAWNASTGKRDVIASVLEHLRSLQPPRRSSAYADAGQQKKNAADAGALVMALETAVKSL